MGGGSVAGANNGQPAWTGQWRRGNNATVYTNTPDGTRGKYTSHDRPVTVTDIISTLQLLLLLATTASAFKSVISQFPLFSKGSSRNGLSIQGTFVELENILQSLCSF